MCGICIVAGVVSGALGGWLGFEVPKTKEGKLLAGGLTAAATGLSVIALKVIFHVSPCGGGTGITVTRIALVLVKTIPMALIYGVAINFLVARFVEKKPSEKQEELLCKKDPQQEKPCCCSENN